MSGFGLRKRISRVAGWVFGGAKETEGFISAAPTVPVREVIERFWPYARPYRRWMPVILVFIALGPAIEAATVWLYKILVDDVLVAKDFSLLFWVALAYIGLNLFSGVVGFCDDCLSEWVGGNFVVELRTSFFAHLQSLSLGFFDRHQLGDVLSRVTEDVEEIEELVLSGVAAALSYLFQLIFFTAALFYLNWQLALVSLFVAPLFWLTARHFSRKIKRAAREERRRSGSISAVAEESLSNAALVQAYNRQDEETSRFHRENEGSFAAQMAGTRLAALFSPIISIIELAGVLVVIAFGAYQLSQGRISIGGLLVFLVYLSMLYKPIKGFSSLLNSYYAASAGAERIIEFLDEKPSVVEREDAIALTRSEGRLELDSVSFYYPDSERPSLENLSFDIGPGEVLALVGPSGAGKSTVAKLLLRFYDPESGAIRLDDRDVRDFTLRSLRDNVAVLLQETLVFDGTIQENIAYGKPDATEGEIVSAAEAADADDFIRGLPDGYDTIIGQKGRLLSGGQRQRVAIARAMIRNAPVLILDEPTTGLDAESGEKVMAPLRRLMSGRTTVVISHNLMTVRDATKILVLEGGKTTEQGTHEALISANGQYAKLYRLHGEADAKANFSKT